MIRKGTYWKLRQPEPRRKMSLMVWLTPFAKPLEYRFIRIVQDALSAVVTVKIKGSSAVAEVEETFCSH
jgi:hypothetical protein